MESNFRYVGRLLKSDMKVLKWTMIHMKGDMGRIFQSLWNQRKVSAFDDLLSLSPKCHWFMYVTSSKIIFKWCLGYQEHERILGSKTMFSSTSKLLISGHFKIRTLHSTDFYRGRILSCWIWWLSDPWLTEISIDRAFRAWTFSQSIRTWVQWWCLHNLYLTFSCILNEYFWVFSMGGKN